jgi:hypothetical protein
MIKRTTLASKKYLITIMPKININLVVNPKRHGLFGQLNTGGGVESTHFGKTLCNSSQFHSRSTNGITYES